MKLGQLKLFYFLISFSVGSFQFVNLYYDNIGLTNTQIGMLFAVGPFVMIFAQPLWGLMTDYWNSPKITLRIMTLGAALTALFFPISHSFEHLLLLNMLYFFFQSSIQPIADGTAMSVLEDPSDFGKIRLWGSLGYALGVLSLGKILDLVGLSWLFIIQSLVLVIALLFSMNLPINTAGKRRFHVQEAVRLFTNPAFILFLAFSLLVNLTVNANNSFYAIHLDNLGASITLVGIALMIKSILEIPFFAMSKKLMHRFSFRILLSAVAIVYAFRWFIAGYNDNLQVLVWSQILLSLSFSIQYFVSAAYVDLITPERYRATGQTFYWAVTFGIGGLIGNMLAGWILNNIEIGIMYRIAGIITMLSVSILWIKPMHKRNK